MIACIILLKDDLELTREYARPLEFGECHNALVGHARCRVGRSRAQFIESLATRKISIQPAVTKIVPGKKYKTDNQRAWLREPRIVLCERWVPVYSIRLGAKELTAYIGEGVLVQHACRRLEKEHCVRPEVPIPGMANGPAREELQPVRRCWDTHILWMFACRTSLSPYQVGV